MSDDHHSERASLVAHADSAVISLPNNSSSSSTGYNSSGSSSSSSSGNGGTSLTTATTPATTSNNSGGAKLPSTASSISVRARANSHSGGGAGGGGGGGGGGSSSAGEDEPLPTYEAVTGNAPPPTYESLFGRIRDEREHSRSLITFVFKVIIILMTTIGCSMALAFSLGIPLSMIIMGAKYWNAPCETENFRLYLVVGGVCGLVSNLYSLCKKKKPRGESQAAEDEDEAEETSCTCISMRLLDIFIFVWFIVGNVWVYRFDAGDDYEHCDKTLYLFTFWSITSLYIIFGGLACLIIVLGCCCSLCMPRSRSEADANEDSDSEDDDLEAGRADESGHGQP